MHREKKKLMPSDEVRMMASDGSVAVVKSGWNVAGLSRRELGSVITAVSGLGRGRSDFSWGLDKVFTSIDVLDGIVQPSGVRDDRSRR